MAETGEETAAPKKSKKSSAAPANEVSPEAVAVADAEPGEDVDPPEAPPEPTTPLNMREPEQAAAPGSQAPAVALAASEDAEDVGVDEQSGRIFRSAPGVLISDSAASAESAGEAPSEETPPQITGWVRLGELSGDLEKYSGREAAVINAPVEVNDDVGFTTTGGKLTTPEGAVITVRTRDQDSAVLQITAEDVAEVVPSRYELPTAG